MSGHDSTIPAQDIQNHINGLTNFLAKEGPKIQRAMRPWLEEAEQRNQDKGRHALLLRVEHMQRNYAAKMAQEHEERRRQLELEQYADQDWFST